MANSTKCLTSGAWYHIGVDENSITAKVDLPFKLDINEKEAEIIEALVHNQLELVLRSYFEAAKIS